MLTFVRLFWGFWGVQHEGGMEAWLHALANRHPDYINSKNVMLTATSCCSSDSPAAAAAPGADRPTRSRNAVAGAALVAVATAAAAFSGDDGGAGGRKGAGAHQRLGRAINAYINSFHAPPPVDGRGGLVGSARADEGWLLSLLLLLLLLRLRLLLPSPWRGSVVGRLCACCRVVGHRRRKPAAAGEGTGAADGRRDSGRDDARPCTVEGAGRKAARSKDDGGGGAIGGDGMTTASATHERAWACFIGFELGWTISRAY